MPPTICPRLSRNARIQSYDPQPERLLHPIRRSLQGLVDLATSVRDLQVTSIHALRQLVARNAEGIDGSAPAAEDLTTADDIARTLRSVALGYNLLKPPPLVGANAQRIAVLVLSVDTETPLLLRGGRLVDRLSGLTRAWRQLAEVDDDVDLERIPAVLYGLQNRAQSW